MHVYNIFLINKKKLFFILFHSNKLRREIRNKNIFKVSDSSPTDLPLNLEKSRIRNQALLKVCYSIFFRLYEKKIQCTYKIKPN